MVIQGIVTDYDGDEIRIAAPFTDTQFFIDKEVKTCEIRLDDGRSISSEQRKIIYALLRDISDWSGFLPEQAKEIMKYEYISRTGSHYFSLADTDMSTAREFTQFLIEFCVEWSVPCRDRLLDSTPDIKRYVYACLMAKCCAICGKSAELHHVDAVGRGRDRRKIIHLGMRCLPLCRTHHTECETIGNKTFMELNKLEPIRIDEKIERMYKL